jgi:hypothetical protein
LGLIVAMAAVLAALVPVSASGATDPKVSNGVTQYFDFYYNEQTCSSPNAWYPEVFQITLVNWRWRRDLTTKTVTNAQPRVGSYGFDCSNRMVNKSYAPAKATPCWGTKCPSGSTSTFLTRTYSLSVSWPYTGGEAGTMQSQVGGSLSSEIRVSGVLKARVCSRINLVGSIPCE